jgi:hypothetical protein
MRMNLIIISKICDISKSNCSYACSFLLEKNLYSVNKPDILETSAGLVSSFCHIIRVFIRRISLLFDTRSVMGILRCCCFGYHSGLHTM